MDIFQQMFDAKKKATRLRVENTNLVMMLKWSRNYIDNAEVKEIISDFLDSDKTVTPNMSVTKPNEKEIAQMGYPVPKAREAPNTSNMSKTDIEKNIAEHRQSVLDLTNPIKKKT